MEPVYLHLSEPSGKLPAGSSRFWGIPDLPSGEPYPVYKDASGKEHPYVFVCQINLEEVPCGPANPLPGEGLLSFFARIDPYLGNFGTDTGCIGGVVSGADDVKVIYTPKCQGLEPVPFYDSDGNPYDAPGELSVGFSQVPAPAHDEHALFARPDHRQWETWDPPFEDWVILLQIDSFGGSDFELDFMDVGVLDFLISPSDLKNRRFGDVRAIVLSS